MLRGTVHRALIALGYGLAPLLTMGEWRKRGAASITSTTRRKLASSDLPISRKMEVALDASLTLGTIPYVKLGIFSGTAIMDER
jgi:hypothetical protein